jgi:hypothetical protein
MATIDIGSAAIDRDSVQGEATTSFIDKHNPANNTGVLDTFEVFATIASFTNFKAGTFYGSGTSYTYRDHEVIGAVTKGSKQTFTGKNCSVSSGDYLGWKGDGGIEQSYATEIAVYEANLDIFSAGTYTLNDNTLNYKLAWSVYATGETAAAGNPYYYYLQQ